MMNNETRVCIVVSALAVVLGASLHPALAVLASVVLGMWLGRGIYEMNDIR